jgi:hypothetical protein
MPTATRSAATSRLRDLQDAAALLAAVLDGEDPRHDPLPAGLVARVATAADRAVSELRVCLDAVAAGTEARTE